MSERSGPLPGVENATRVVFAPDGHSLVIGGTKGEVRIWSLTNINRLLQGPAFPVSDMAFRPQANELVVLYTEKQIQVTCWALASGNKLRSNVLPEDISAAILSPDGMKVFASDRSGQPVQFTLTAEGLSPDSRVSDRIKGIGPVQPLLDQVGIGCHAIDRSGKLLALTSNGNRTTIWDMKEAKIIVTWDNCGSIRGMAFTSDGSHVLSLNSNGTVYVLSLPR